VLIPIDIQVSLIGFKTLSSSAIVVVDELPPHDDIIKIPRIIMLITNL
jgi:hypothetical protein